MPYGVMPAWLRGLAYLNPVSFAIDSIRALQEGVILWSRLGALVVLAVVVIGGERLSLQEGHHLTRGAAHALGRCCSGGTPAGPAPDPRAGLLPGAGGLADPGIPVYTARSQGGRGAPESREDGVEGAPSSGARALRLEYYNN